MKSTVRLSSHMFAIQYVAPTLDHNRNFLISKSTQWQWRTTNTTTFITYANRPLSIAEDCLSPKSFKF